MNVHIESYWLCNVTPLLDIMRTSQHRPAVTITCLLASVKNSGKKHNPTELTFGIELFTYQQQQVCIRTRYGSL